MENPNQLIATMPDTSITYKILQESGQQVNIFDWLTAFNTVANSVGVDGDDDEDIPAHIQYSNHNQINLTNEINSIQFI